MAAAATVDKVYDVGRGSWKDDDDLWWCGECDAGGFTDSEMLEHELIHAVPGRYPCAHMWCFFAADRESDRRKHNQEHFRKGPRPTMCLHHGCGFRTASYDLMRRHKTVSGKHVHACPGCDAHFPSGFALRAHIDQMHLPEEECGMECADCDQVCVDRSSMAQHLIVSGHRSAVEE